MSHVFAKNAESKTCPSDRRVFPRQTVRSLAYVELGEGNGGIVLNVSETGLAVQAVMSLMTDELPCMRLQLAHSQKQIEAKGRIAWTSEFRKLVGVEFVDLSPEALRQIREWVSLEKPGAPGGERNPVKKAEPVATVTAVPTSAKIADIVADPPITAHPEVKPKDEAPLQEPTPAPAALPAASAVLAVPEPNARSLPSISPPADRYGFKPSVPARPLPPPESASVHNRKKTAALVGTFAILSLAVGWVAGRAGLREVIGQTAGESRPAEIAAESAIASPNISGIEVVDVNNQRWLIPFNGPPTPSKHDALGQTAESPSSGSGEKSGVDQASAVSSPVHAKSSTASAGAERSGPPAAPSFTSTEKVFPPAASSNSHSPIPAPPAPARSANDGDLRPGELLHRVEPAYPADALTQGIEGAVKLLATIDPDGTVKTVQALSGPSVLFPAAVSAVSQWRYSPTLLDGRPIQIERQITITFRLSPTQSK